MTEKAFIKNVCTNIRQTRMSKGMSQVDLANACDFDRQNMQRIESGKTSPTLKTLFKIAKALDVSVSDLVATKV